MYNSYQTTSSYQLQLTRSSWPGSQKLNRHFDGLLDLGATVPFMRRVDYVIQYVESLSRSVAFYRDVIGLRVRIEGDGYVEFELENTKFSLFERSKLPGLIGREGGNPPCGEIGFLVEDVDGEAERLRGLGVEILSGPVDRPWHERTLHIADPDGNIVEFAEKLR